MHIDAEDQPEVLIYVLQLGLSSKSAALQWELWEEISEDTVLLYSTWLPPGRAPRCNTLMVPSQTPGQHWCAVKERVKFIVTDLESMLSYVDRPQWLLYKG